MRKRLTVVVPLHRAEPWVNTVIENVGRIPSWARVVLSDISQDDDAIDVLQGRLKRNRRTRFRRRTSGGGWREHINQLIRRARTEYLSILAQDDSVEDGYYEALVGALDSYPRAGVAFGSLVSRMETGEEIPHPPPPFPLGVRPPWVEAFDLDHRWNLGVPYRGVVRTRLLAPVPPTPGDRYADAMWVFSIGLAAHLVEVPGATYHKRYHPGNTHVRWSPLSGGERFTALRAEIDRRLSGNPVAHSTAMARLEARFPRVGADSE